MAKKEAQTVKKVDPEKEFKKLGNRIREIRRGQGFTSAEKFANARNLPRAQYAKYEKGKNLNYDTLLHLMAALDISIVEFFSQGFEE